MSNRGPNPEPLFALGQTLATPAALDACEAANVAPSELLHRHVSGDYGDIPAEDARENELGIRRGFRVLSSYPLGEDGERVWIITERDRSATTILKPEEY